MLRRVIGKVFKVITSAESASKIDFKIKNTIKKTETVQKGNKTVKKATILTTAVEVKTGNVF